MKIVNKVPDPPAVVNLCDEVPIGEDLMINFTYKNIGRKIIY